MLFRLFFRLFTVVTTTLFTAQLAQAQSAMQLSLFSDNDANYEAYKSDDDQKMHLRNVAKSDLEEGLMSLEAHGLDSAPYLEQLQSVEAEDDEAQSLIIREAVADLRFGATREDDGAMIQDEVDRKISELEECEDLKLCFQTIAARHPQYEPLQIVLGQYQEIAKAGGWTKLESGASLKPGNDDLRVPKLRAILKKTGDYREVAAAKETTQEGAASQPTLYDDSLVEAVERFQKRHGLKVDGVVGPTTLAMLNMPIEKRIDQLKLSLERLRRLDDTGESRHVMINIPSYHLIAYDGDAKALEMDVIVGQRSRPTPLFENSITTVGLNPTWTPTYKILSRDLLPKFRNDPGYASRGGYSVRDRYTGERMDPYSVDWHSVSARDVQVVQRSGSQNALGKVKFLLPDNDSVYLHDTSKPKLFSEAKRALSSGCIRLSKPEEFLDYVIAAQPDTRFENLREYYKGNANKHITLDQPVSVKVTYFTAWVNDGGEVEFYDDVYSKDDRLQLALDRGTRQFAMQ